MGVMLFGFSYQEVLIINAKPLSEVSKHQRAVLLELEMAGHVLPVQKSENTSDMVFEMLHLLKNIMKNFENDIYLTVSTLQSYEILKKTLLVEEVVVHFDLRIGLEVVWHEHDGNLNMA